MNPDFPVQPPRSEAEPAQNASPETNARAISEGHCEVFEGGLGI